MPNRKTLPLIKISIATLYCIIIITLGLACLKKPYYNWDMIPYMALILKVDQSNPVIAHNETYAACKKYTSADVYNNLTDSLHSYKKKMATDPVAFDKQLAFYVVKPFYIGLCYLFYRAGASLVIATVLPSVVFYILIGFLLFYWVRRYAPSVLAFFICSSIMASVPMFDVARLSTPDCVASFFLLTAIFFIIEKRFYNIALAFLVLAVFTRIENVIFAFGVISLLRFASVTGGKISTRRYLTMLAILIISYFIITLNANHYSWGALYFNSFFSQYITLKSRDSLHPVLSLYQYMRTAYGGLLVGAWYTYLALFIAFAFIVILSGYILKLSIYSFEQLLIITILLVMAIRFVLQPEISDRYYIAYYLIIIMVLIRRLDMFKVLAEKTAN